MSENFDPDKADRVPGGDPEDFPDAGKADDPNPTTGGSEGEPVDLDLDTNSPEPSNPLRGLVESLNSTEPSKPLSEVETMWNPEEGGATRIARGFQKATGSDGLPAWVDFVVGIGELYVERAKPNTSKADADSGDSPGVTDMGGEITE